MTTVPHGVSDLYMAPVVIAIDARIEQLGKLDLAQLEERVALDSNRPDWSREDRVRGLLESIRYLIDCHRWLLSWDSRGVRLAHGDYSIVLGVPGTFVEYVERRPVNRAVAERPTASA
jgi:hypothetical protein